MPTAHPIPPHSVLVTSPCLGQEQTSFYTAGVPWTLAVFASASASLRSLINTVGRRRMALLDAIHCVIVEGRRLERTRPLHGNYSNSVVRLWLAP